MKDNVRAIAIYLPQFHPFEENDRWWGKGFTEWTNVAKSKSRFKGHKQPHLPADLGFYDLRLEQARNAQAELARQYGIYGFCYYHYWFSGKRLMNAPIDAILETGKPDFPFMLCWANETWSRRWMGEEKEVLIKQEYGVEDDYDHALWLCKNLFNDKRYITVNGRPVFMIYRPHDLPDYNKTIDIIKEVATSLGLPEPYFIASNSHSNSLTGFDNIMNFQPQLNLLKDAFIDKPSISRFLSNRKLNVNSFSLKIYDYKAVKKILSSVKLSYKYLPCIFVGWDNSPRRGKRGIIIVNQNPQDFKQSLIEAKKMVEQNDKDERIVFINAWNEWAEGNYLEPDSESGHQYLQAVKEVFNGT